MIPPGAHLPNRVMASRQSTGVTYSLARNSCWNTSMRSECAMCGRGAEFPRASARRCLTFPHDVYSAHRIFVTEFFPLQPDVRDSPTALRLTTYCRSSVLSWWTADPPRFASWSVWPDFSHCTGTNSQFLWILQYIFIYTAGPSTLRGVRPRTASFPLFTQGGARRNSRISLNSEMK